MTGGAAVADYDGDGWSDLMVTRLGAPDILYRNRGDGTFEDVTAVSGLDEFSFLSNGAAWADIDNDGDPAPYVTGPARHGSGPNKARGKRGTTSQRAAPPCSRMALRAHVMWGASMSSPVSLRA